MNDIEFRQKMIDTFTAASIPWMTDETCAMLLAEKGYVRTDA